MKDVLKAFSDKGFPATPTEVCDDEQKCANGYIG